MTIFVKVHMTLCNYSDAGSIIEKEQNKPDQKEAEVRSTFARGISYELLTPAEIANGRYLIKLPSFVDWFTYMMLVSTSWCGPTVEYAIYKDFMEREKDSHVAKMPRFGNWPAAWKRFAEVWLLAIAFSVLSAFIDYEYMTKPAFNLEPVWYKIFTLCMSMQIKMM